MKAVLLRSGLVVCGLVVYGVGGGGAATGGRAGGRRASGGPVWLGGGLLDGVGRAGGGTGGVRPWVLCGSDVRAMRGLRGPIRTRPARRWAGRSRTARRRGLGGAALSGVRLSWRVWVHRFGFGGCNGPVVEEGLGLDRSARREIQEGLAGPGLRPGRCGRAVRRPDPGGDWWLAVVSRSACDGLSGQCGGGGAAAVRRRAADVPATACCRRVGRGSRGGSSRHRRVSRPAPAAATAELEGSVLAVDDEQHEPCGVRGVSIAVPERRVSGAGRGPAGRASLAGRRGPGSRNRCWRPRVAGAWSPVGRCFRPGLRVGVGWRFAASSWRCVPGLRGVSGDGGDGGRPAGAGPLRGDGGRVSGVRVGDGRRMLAGSRVSTDGPSSGDVRELGRRGGVRVVAEP